MQLDADMKNTLDFFESYVTDERKLSPRTVSSYMRVVRRFMRHCCQAQSLREVASLGSVDVGMFLRLVAPGADGPAKASWNLQLSALRTFFVFLQRAKLVSADPTKHVRHVKVTSEPVDPPSLDEVLLLLDAICSQSPPSYRRRNVLIVQLLFHCSLRVSELVSIDVDQIRLDRSKVNGFRILDVRRKGDKRQHIVFNDVVAEAIENYLVDRGSLDLPSTMKALILSDRRQRISDSTVRRMVRRYSELAGIRRDTRRVSPHSIRHSSASEMERDGARPSVIQRHLGHASIQTTQRYLHAEEAERRAAVDGIGERFKRRRGGT